MKKKKRLKPTDDIHLRTIEEGLHEVEKIEEPSVQRSFVGKTAEEAAKFMLGALQGIKEWSESDFSHTHADENANTYECQNLGCDWRFWHHPEVIAVLEKYPELEGWVNKDQEKFNSLLLLGMAADQKVVDGKIISFLGLKMQRRKLIGGIMALFTSTSIGTIIGIIIG